MSERKSHDEEPAPKKKHDDQPLYDEVTAADDTGMVSGEADIVRIETEEGLA